VAEKRCIVQKRQERGFGRDIIVIGASAGGVEALSDLSENLPADLSASVFIVLHVPPERPSLLPQILGRRTSLKVQHGVDGQRIRHGHVYVAPPDHHLELEGERMVLSRGPRENRARPSIDALFRSAAHSHGARVAGVVLTGNLDDGTAGLHAIKRRGGVAIVQDPAAAKHPGMPQSALLNVEIDHCVPLPEIVPILVRLATTRTIRKSKKRLPRLPEPTMSPQEMIKQFGPPTPYPCPECAGPMWKTDPGSLALRCHVGHRFSPDTLLSEYGDGLERTLWSAVRMFDERASLLRQLKDEKFHSQSVADLESKAREHEEHSKLLRKVLQNSR
jgi:two-component system, chemotaxis family, protein-glutamate methylesterase/glutaminase